MLLEQLLIIVRLYVKHFTYTISLDPLSDPKRAVLLLFLFLWLRKLKLTEFSWFAYGQINTKCRVWTQGQKEQFNSKIHALYHYTIWLSNNSKIIVKIIATTFWAPAIIARHCVKYFAYFKPLKLHIKCKDHIIGPILPDEEIEI